MHTVFVWQIIIVTERCLADVLVCHVGVGSINMVVKNQHASLDFTVSNISFSTICDNGLQRQHSCFTAVVAASSATLQTIILLLVDPDGDFYFLFFKIQYNKYNTIIQQINTPIPTVDNIRIQIYMLMLYIHNRQKRYIHTDIHTDKELDKVLHRQIFALHKE